MKPCSENRKRIAWMAAGALEPSEAEQIRRHMETCDGCRTYGNEISRLTALLSVEPESTIHAAEAFHQRVMTALRDESKSSFWHSVAAQVRESVTNWRVALPLAGTVALAITALVLSSGRDDRIPSRREIQTSSSHPAVADLDPPTLSHYQTVANRSLEKFDDLLSAQANKNPSAGPIFSASPLGRAAALD